MNSCFEVFVGWDDEYDRLQVSCCQWRHTCDAWSRGCFVTSWRRSVMKARRWCGASIRRTSDCRHDWTKWESMLFVIRFNWFLKNFFRFRRQHEQLRQVIVRVLRPTVTARPGSPSGHQGDAGDDANAAAEPVMDASDASAIEEVGVVVVSIVISANTSQTWPSWYSIRKTTSFFQGQLGVWKREGGRRLGRVQGGDWLVGGSCETVNWFLPVLRLRHDLFQVRRANRPRGDAHHSAPARPAGHGEERQRDVPHLFTL